MQGRLYVAIAQTSLAACFHPLADAPETTDLLATSFSAYGAKHDPVIRARIGTITDIIRRDLASAGASEMDLPLLLGTLEAAHCSNPKTVATGDS